MWGFMRHKISRSRQKHQKGSAMLEGALTLVVFVSLFLGAIDLAQILLIHQSIVERVRSVARVTSVTCCDTDTVKNLVLYGQTATPSQPSGYYGLTASNVAVTFSDQNSPDQRLTIRVTGFQYRSFTPMLAGVSNGIPVQVSIPLEQP